MQIPAFSSKFFQFFFLFEDLLQSRHICRIQIAIFFCKAFCLDTKKRICKSPILFLLCLQMDRRIKKRCDFPLLFSRSNMLPLIVASIIFGFGVSICGGPECAVGKLLNNLSDIIMKVVSILMYYAPIGLFAFFASLIGEFGPTLIGNFGRAMLLYYPLCVLYFFIAFPLYARFAGGKGAAKKLFQHILKPAVTSLGTCSSIATIPANMEAAEEIGIPRDVSDIVLPLGATMHMDGSVFSAILKISFLFGFFGMPFDGIGTYVTALMIAIFSGIAMSGVAGGGFVGEMVIVSLFFPEQMGIAFPVIATIGALVEG